MPAEIASGKREPDDIGDGDHVVFRRSLPCGAKCSERASRWARCQKCQGLVARCAAHESRFQEQVQEHCR